jgi:hypothetical protein
LWNAAEHWREPTLSGTVYRSLMIHRRYDAICSMLKGKSRSILNRDLCMVFEGGSLRYLGLLMDFKSCFRPLSLI